MGRGGFTDDGLFVGVIYGWRAFLCLYVIVAGTNSIHVILLLCKAVIRHCHWSDEDRPE